MKKTTTGADFTRQATERKLADFKECGIEKYVIRTCGDGRVCDICKSKAAKSTRLRMPSLAKTPRRSATSAAV